MQLSVKAAFETIDIGKFGSLFLILLKFQLLLKIPLVLRMNILNGPLVRATPKRYIHFQI